MDFNQINKELFSFLDNSPNAFFAVKNMCDILDKNGMTRLYEGKPWDLESDKGYYPFCQGVLTFFDNNSVNFIPQNFVCFSHNAPARPL